MARQAHFAREGAPSVRLDGLFQKYSDQHAFDWFLMAAQGYQESGLDHRLLKRTLHLAKTYWTLSCYRGKKSGRTTL